MLELQHFTGVSACRWRVWVNCVFLKVCDGYCSIRFVFVMSFVGVLLGSFFRVCGMGVSESHAAEVCVPAFLATGV